MHASAEISHYPLNAAYEEPILDFIQRLGHYTNLSINTNEMSTQVSGDYEDLMRALTKEMRTSFQQPNTQLFVIKLINVGIDVGPGYEREHN